MRTTCIQPGIYSSCGYGTLQIFISVNFYFSIVLGMVMNASEFETKEI